MFSSLESICMKYCMSQPTFSVLFPKTMERRKSNFSTDRYICMSFAVSETSTPLNGCIVLGDLNS